MRQFKSVKFVLIYVLFSAMSFYHRYDKMGSPTANLVGAETWKVDCATQSSEGYIWGTKTALVVLIISGFWIMDLLIKPTVVGEISALTFEMVLAFLWPMIIGRNSACSGIAIQNAKLALQNNVNIYLNNHTIARRQQFFDGLAGTAEKANAWVPIIRDKSLSEQERRDAQVEYFDTLELLYLKANEERSRLFSGSAFGKMTNQQAIDLFLVAKQLSLMQIGFGVEILTNPQLDNVSVAKWAGDLREDARFYWTGGHMAIERLVGCLPNAKMGKARRELIKNLYNMFDFVGKMINKDITKWTYDSKQVYRPVQSGNRIALRLNDTTLITFEELNGKTYGADGEVKKVDASCPSCDGGFGLFARPNNTSSDIKNEVKDRLRCRDSVFQISKPGQNGTPIRTCDTVTLTHFRFSLQNSKSQYAEIEYQIDAFDESDADVIADCGRLISDRDRVKLTNSKLPATFDTIIIKVN